MNTTKKILLGSASPRRRELLQSLGLTFEVVAAPGIDETFPSGLSCEQIPQHIALQKAKGYTLADDQLLITADTIVWLDGQVLGKPVDAEDACRMLRLLSGHTHQVVTGVALTTSQWTRSFSSLTHVTFAPLSEEEIRSYVDRFSPLDKAGAYGIQEWIGYIGVTRLEGSFYNVMGLPVQLLYTELNKLNVII